jgi:hypothetical protein
MTRCAPPSPTLSFSKWSSARETARLITTSLGRDVRATDVRQTYPERCLEPAFQFLLDREPKESILRRFDIAAISRYFPEFERESPHYLSQS